MDEVSLHTNSTHQVGVSLDAALEKLLQERFSCRAFLENPVPKETIECILQLSQRPPSWCNTQPWQIIVTRNEGTERFRKALYQHAISAATPQPDFPFPKEYK